MTRRCPIALAQNPIVSEVLGLYQHWEHGHLPVAGGIKDQPAAFSAFMLEVASLKAESESWYESALEERDARTKARASHHSGHN